MPEASVLPEPARLQEPGPHREPAQEPELPDSFRQTWKYNDEIGND